jgi:hypothetical protein
VKPFRGEFRNLSFFKIVFSFVGTTSHFSRKNKLFLFARSILAIGTPGRKTSLKKNVSKLWVG